MIKALDFEIENMEIESLLKSESADHADLDRVLDLLEKGVAHKYLRRTGGPGSYRYFYSATHAAIPGNSDPQVGEKIRVGDEPQEDVDRGDNEAKGHYEVTHLHGNGMLTMKHDVTGKTLRVHKDTLREMSVRSNKGAIDERRAQLQRVHDQAQKTGTPRQVERAHAALQAHTQAFGGDPKKYEAARAHADTLSGRYLSDKFVTTHNHLEAMGAHHEAAHHAPNEATRNTHEEMIGKHQTKLNDLKAMIAERDANPGKANAKAASEAAKRATLTANESKTAAAHEHAADAHEKARDYLMNNGGDAATIEGHKVDAQSHREDAAGYAKTKADKGAAPGVADLKTAEKTIAGAGKSHEDTVKDFRTHFMGTGTRAPKALSGWDKPQKYVGDKEAMTKEELKASPEKIQAVMSMAKEKGGKAKAIDALKDARDHWRYMAKLHNGRNEGQRYKKPSKDSPDHVGNMMGARMMRDHLDAKLQEVRALRTGKKAADVDSEGKPLPPAGSAAATKRIQQGNKNATRIKDLKDARTKDKGGPLGEPHLKEDRHGNPQSFWEGTSQDKGEASGKPHDVADFDPEEHKDLPKGSTLHVYAPNGPDSKGEDGNDFHLYRHEGHGELKPMDEKSSKHVNTLADLKGHDVRVTHPGDTKTGDLFTEGKKRVQEHREAHNKHYSEMARSEGPLGDLAKAEAALAPSVYYPDHMQKGAGVLDDDVWKRAKKAALKSKAEGDPGFYAVVTTIYKSMGGRYSHDAEKGEEDPPLRKAGIAVEARNALAYEGGEDDDRYMHRPRMQAPRQQEIQTGSAPAVIGPNAGVVRTLSVARVKEELRKAILDSYRAELMALERGNALVQTVKKQGSAYSRLSVPSQMIKALNTGEPEEQAVVDGAVARLKALSKENPQVRQGLALTKLTPTMVREAFLKMGLTPERVFAGRV